MRKIVRFRSSLIRTVYAKVKSEFVRTYIVTEEEAAPLLSEINLNGLNRHDYMALICENYLVEPKKVYTGLNEESTRRLTEELFDLIVAENSYLDPSNLEQVEFPTETRTRRRRKKVDPNSEIAESIRIYEKVKSVLYDNIVGQREAVDKVISCVGRGLLRSAQDKRPICSLFFAGYSGVGKTEVARKLAEALQVDSEERLIRIDCAEYSESHQVARLVGAPQGYVGYDEPSYLEQHLNPEIMQVLLFDEFEKSDPKLWNLLLGALEEGSLTTGNHTQLNLRNCIIILTSNLGTRELSSNGLGFTSESIRVEGNPRKNISDKLPVELVNRLTEIIIFRALSTEEKRDIVVIELNKLREQLTHIVRFYWDYSIIEEIVMSCKEKGVREIRKKCEDVHGEIARKILNNEIEIGSEFILNH